MITKNTVENPAAPDLSALYSWGLRVRDIEEFLFVTGHGDVDAHFQVRHPGDSIGQMRAVLDEIKALLARADYTFDNVIQIVLTVTKEFELAKNFDALVATWAEYLAGVPIKPSGGTLRVVEALAVPGMNIEIEMIAAR